MHLNRAVARRLAVRLDGAGDDRGLTLIELLVTIAIMSIVAGPLAAALITYFQHLDDTTDRLSLSHDAQIAAAHFGQDVASVGRRDWSTDGFPLLQSVYLDSSGPYPCGSGDRTVVRLLRDEPTAGHGSGSVLAVAYWVRTVNGQRQLHRVACDSAGTVTSDLVVAYNLGTADPVASCTPGCGVAAVQTVTVILDLKSPRNDIPDLVVPLYGQRRQTT